MKLRSEPINTLSYEAFKQQFQTILMKFTGEHFRNCAETLKASKGSNFLKAISLFTRSRETIPLGCLVSNKTVRDSNADEFEHHRNTFFSDGFLV